MALSPSYIIAWWSPNPGIAWHCEVRYGLLVMNNCFVCLELRLFVLCGLIARSMSEKRVLVSKVHQCPFMVQSGQLMSGRLRSPPTQST